MKWLLVNYILNIYIAHINVAINIWVYALLSIIIIVGNNQLLKFLYL